MADGIILKGMEQFIDSINNMTLTEIDEKEAITKGMEVIIKEIEKNTPSKTEKLNKIKQCVKKEGKVMSGTANLGTWWDLFQEFGTSQQKHHIGFFDRAIKSSEDEAFKVIAKDLLKKIK